MSVRPTLPALLALLAILCLTPANAAQLQTLTGEYHQESSGSLGDSVARVAATTRAEEALLSQGEKLVRQTEAVRKAQPESEDIQALTAAIIRSDVISDGRYETDGKSGIAVILKSDINTAALEEATSRMIYDGEALDKWRRALAAEHQLLEEFAKLETENSRLLTGTDTDPAAKEALRSRFEILAKRLAAVQWFKSAMSNWAFGSFTDTNRAKAALKECLDLDPIFAPAYIASGQLAMASGDNKTAIELFSHALDIDPRYARAYNNRGMAWVKQNDVRKGIDDFNMAIAIDPKLAGAYSNRGLAHARIGERNLAEEDLNKAISLDPKLSGGLMSPKMDEDADSGTPAKSATGKTASAPTPAPAPTPTNIASALKADPSLGSASSETAKHGKSKKDEAKSSKNKKSHKAKSESSSKKKSGKSKKSHKKTSQALD